MHEHGFLLGKFYPPTLGHIHLITEAAKRCKYLTVIVASQLEDIEDYLPGPIRYKILCEYFEGYPNIKVIHHHANEPQYPQDHARFWNIWLKIVLTYADPSRMDVVFSSEEYGNKFGELLGIKHECIDLDRKTIPISGTMVRNDIWSKWDYLPQETKRHFIKKIAIMGPESTGKTTMTKKLAEHYSCPSVLEYGREYCEQVKPDLNLTDQCFKNILVRHNANFKNAINRCDENIIICDTEHITTKIFYDMYVTTPHQIDLDLIPVEEVDLRLVLYPDNVPVQDGTRKFLDTRMAHMNVIVNTLNERGLPFKVIMGDYDHKFEQCKKHIEDLFFHSITK